MSPLDHNHKIIALLTDFGWQDVYVGVMKGVITSINPCVNIIDLTHDIPPQNLLAARFALRNVFAYFPKNTVYVAVVDPGVGSERKGLAIKVNNRFLIGPNNGIFSGILEQYKPQIAIELSNSQYWLTPNPSFTFHGRDIFAPVAAHLTNGVKLENLGNKININNLQKINISPYQKNKNNILGLIQYIDKFGNLITNIPAHVLVNQSWQVLVDNIPIPTGKTYSSVEKGELVALIASHGWLEIAVNNGNAKIKLLKNWGDEIRVEL